MRAAAALAVVVATGGLGACADPVVTMQLQPAPDAQMFNTSCVSTVEVRAEGMNYPSDPMDYKSISVDVTTSPATYADVEAAIRGKFDVPIPSSGLQAVEIYGWNGPPGWDNATRQNGPPSELVFLGRGMYGGDTVAVDLVPNISCEHQPIKIHTLDLVAFETNNFDCTKAIAPDDPAGNAGVDVGTLTPALYKDTLFFWGGFYGGPFMANQAAFTGPTIVGPDSCLAFDGGDGVTMAGSLGCAASGRGVCGTADDQLEMPTIADPYGVNSLDKAIYNQWKGVTFGGVFTAAKHPVAGATITVDPKLGTVVYAELDTGPSGLFLIYANSIVDVTFTSGATTKTIKVGATADSPAAAVVVLN
jgi:hypothetical protein